MLSNKKLITEKSIKKKTKKIENINVKKCLIKKHNYNCFIKHKSKICELFKIKLIKSKDTKIFDVIIIGAGAAGLTAARNLSYNKKKIVVLEARDRIGGRIHDIKTKNMGNLHLGASWLHYKGNYHILENILKFYKVKYLDNDSLESNESMGIYTKDGKLNDKDNKLFAKILIELPKNIKKYGEKNPKLTVNKVVHLIAKKYNYNKDLINSLIVRSFEHCSMNADIMPALEFDGWEPNGKFIKDGFGKMINKLSDGINIKLNSIVNKINQKEDHVVVYTNRKKYYAKYVISTLPTGVLQSNQIKFIPELPDVKKKSLKNLFSGSHEKIFLKFPYVFWDKNVDVFQYSTYKNRGVCTQWYNILLKVENENILYTNISGPNIEYAKKTDIELEKICMNILKKMFGNNIPNPESIYVTRWSLDKYTLGGPYSHPNKNGKMEDLSIIGCPFDKIHFGGVDTSSDVTETVEAAMLSGIRTSNEIIEKLI